MNLEYQCQNSDMNYMAGDSVGTINASIKINVLSAQFLYRNFPSNKKVKQRYSSQRMQQFSQLAQSAIALTLFWRMNKN